MRSHMLTGPRSAFPHLLVGASADPEIAAVGYTDGTVIFVGASAETCTLDLGDDISDIAISCAGGELILAAALPGSVRLLWPGKRAEKALDLFGHDGRVTKVALFAEAGELLAVSTDERGNVHRWHLPEGRRISVRRAHRKSVHTLIPGRLAPGRMSFLTASDDRQAIIHDLHMESVHHALAPHAGWIDKVACADTDLRLVTVTDRVGLTVWDVARMQAVARIPVNGPENLAFWSGTQDTYVAAVQSGSGQVMLWTSSGIQWIDPPPNAPVDLIMLTGAEGCHHPTLRAALGDQLTELNCDNRWTDNDPPFRRPVLNVRPWVCQPGALIVLEDGSIWHVTW